jgi:hypothetical protein
MFVQARNRRDLWCLAKNGPSHREIPFFYVPFDGLRHPDVPQMLASSKAKGLTVAPIDGDWNVMPAAAGAEERIRSFLRSQL